MRPGLLPGRRYLLSPFPHGAPTREGVAEIRGGLPTE